MLTGYDGHLIAASFLERHLQSQGASIPPSAWRALRAARDGGLQLGPASSRRAMLDCGASPFVHALGYERVERVEASRDHLRAVLPAGSHSVALVVASWGDRLDSAWRHAIVHAGREHASWCLAFNGMRIRLFDARRLYSRRYTEFDIDAALDDERSAAAMWTVLGAHAVAQGAAGLSPLDALIEASARHAAGVCRSLKDGVLEASAAVLGALARPGRERTGSSTGNDAALSAAFEQALTIVYRLLFLLFAEARGLVPVWHPVYRDSYSIGALRAAAERNDQTMGLWDALRAASRLAHAGCRAGDLKVTPFNGRLFAPSRTPLAERRSLDDRAACRAILALATRAAADGAGREPIAYRDLGVEQLGAVYETLLDYIPVRRKTEEESAPARASALSASGVALVRGSGVRKATGTFYTPQPLAEYLVRRTLAPLVRNASSERILSLRVVDPAMGSGAFLVAACGYLAHAYEAALVREGGCHPRDFGPEERALVKRTLAERCLYGVDLNPMAVQLARLSLWLTTLAGDRPLSFLDHRLQDGDTLLGAWVASLGRVPSPKRRAITPTLPLFESAGLLDALRVALPVRFSLGNMPNDTLEQVRAKERALAALTRRDAEIARWKRVADLWCATWFPADASAKAPSARQAFAPLSDAILNGRCELPDAMVRDHLRASEQVAAARRFFHWELEFPEVFFDAAGLRLSAPGFDAVLGNPPWDMVRADAGTADARSCARRDADAVLRFTRRAGVYSAQSDGHANRYQLFVERAVALARPGGRIGLVLPSGLASDHGSARLRRLLFERAGVDALVGFDNRDGVFPIHRSVRFLLVTATAGEPTREIKCRLGERHPSVLENHASAALEAGTNPDDHGPDDAWFPVRLTPSIIEKLSGDDLAIPDVRTPLDLAIAERSAALFPPLGSTAGWAARFGRELNATDDRECFVDRAVSRQGLPVVEGKQLEPFHASTERARWAISARHATALLGNRHLKPRLGYRDVASATNRTTLIAAMLPAGCVTTHTVFCLRTPARLSSQHFLCGIFNSFVANYLVRMRVTTHVTTGIVERLPVPRQDDGPRAFAAVAALSRLLSGSVPDSTRRRAAACLNALVARLYQLTREELEHVLGTFPLVAREERDAALVEFERGRDAMY